MLHPDNWLNYCIIRFLMVCNTSEINRPKGHACLTLAMSEHCGTEDLYFDNSLDVYVITTNTSSGITRLS